MATDGSLLGAAGKWGACGWAVVQLDCDDEVGLLHGMCGSMGAEFQVQRTIKRAELTAFTCLLRKVDPSRSMWTTREQLMGYEKVKKRVSSQEQEMQMCG